MIVNTSVCADLKAVPSIEQLNVIMFVDMPDTISLVRRRAIQLVVKMPEHKPRGFPAETHTLEELDAGRK